MFINEQNDGFIVENIPMKNISFGKGNIADNGCGVIASYNIMRHKGFEEKFLQVKDDIIACRGLNFFGLLGVRPFAIKRYLKRKGIKVKLAFGKKHFVSNSNKADSVIVLLKWKGTLCMHYIAGINDKGVYRYYNSGIADEKGRSIDARNILPMDFLQLVKYKKATVIGCMYIN